METTPDTYCTWKVDENFLKKALAEIREYGSKIMAVTPEQLERISMKRYRVVTYLIIYYNLSKEKEVDHWPSHWK